jgi:hypothetical protein
MALYNSGTSSPFADTAVDNLVDSNSGVIDTLPTLDIDIADAVITKNLENRIQDSIAYWNKVDGFNLEHVRHDNLRQYLGKTMDPNRMYKFQTPYNENQTYVGVNAIIAYLTSRVATPETYPSSDTPQSKNFASNLEKALQAWADLSEFEEKQEDIVRNAMIKRLGALYFYYDPDADEVCADVIDPEHLVIDKNAKAGKNPAFIAHFVKMSANEALSRWPKAREQLFAYLGIKMGTPKQMESMLNIRRVHLTHYDKQFKAQEAVVHYIGNVVFEKSKDPNWIYTQEELNFLKSPQKPYIPLNFDNDGNHWIDYTTAIEQARPMQEVLNKRGRQLMEAADKANGILIVSSDTGLTKDDLQNITGDPNQRLLVKTVNAQRVEDLVLQLPPQQVSPILMTDKVDLRTQVHAMLGSPSEFTGTPDGSDAPETLGQSNMKKNQASGRQDLYVRSLDRFNSRVFQYAVQMFAVWYNEKHNFVFNSGDGDFDYVTMSRGIIDKKTIVKVKSGSTKPFDRESEEALGLALMKMEAISPLDGYKMLHIQNPQQTFDNFAKFSKDPESLARDSKDEMSSNQAYEAYADLMAGRKIEGADDVDKEFVLTMRKLMLRDDFLKADRKKQNAVLDFVSEAIKRMELRVSLDAMAEVDGTASLDPHKKIVPIEQTEALQQRQQQEAAAQNPNSGGSAMPPAPMAPPQAQPPMGQPPMGGQPPMSAIPQPQMVPIPAGPMAAPIAPPAPAPQVPPMG